MITGRAVSALLLHHHRRVVMRRAVNYDFAGALTPDHLEPAPTRDDTRATVTPRWQNPLEPATCSRNDAQHPRRERSRLASGDGSRARLELFAEAAHAPETSSIQ